MVDLELLQVSMRKRLAQLVVATTGSATLATTTTGYSRSSGSFITDRFAKGMEITPVGFSANNNTTTADFARVISAEVVAGFLTTNPAPASVEGATAGRSISVKLPRLIEWENEELVRKTGRPYITEEMVPGGLPRLITFPIKSGKLEETGLYIVTLFGIQGTGNKAIRRYMKAMKDLFAPGTVFTAGSDSPHVSGVFAGQILPAGNGYASCALQVAWEVRTTNSIAA